MIVLILLGLLFGLDTAKEKERFISLAGLVVCIFSAWIFSKKRRKVSAFFHQICVSQKRHTFLLFFKETHES